MCGRIPSLECKLNVPPSVSRQHAVEPLAMIFKHHVHVFRNQSVNPAYGLARVAYVCPVLGIERTARLSFQATPTSTELSTISLGPQRSKRHSNPRKVVILTESRSGTLLIGIPSVSSLLARTVVNMFREMNDAGWDVFL